MTTEAEASLPEIGARVTWLPAGARKRRGGLVVDVQGGIVWVEHRQTTRCGSVVRTTPVSLSALTEEPLR